MPQRTVVALSGGVDSAVAAALLQAEGHELLGVYMKNWINEDRIAGHCPWEEDIVDARAVADALGIPFRVVNFIRDYRERVVSYLVEGYARGLTPNPDVMCNREMKFGVLLDWARAEGYEAVATGHYVRREAIGAPFPRLFEGVDKNKDQSYFLALLRPAQAAAARFPLGGLTKPEVRARAHELGLPNAGKKDSQGICFIGEVRINDFLAQYLPDQPGEIVDPTGRVLGSHQGLHRFTLGQRKGIGLPSNTDHEHYVVVAKEMAANRLVVAFDRPDAPGLYRDHAVVHGLSWLAPPVETARELLVKVRYRDPSVAAQFVPLPDGRAELRFAEPQRGLASGQIAALYAGEQLLGGGIFS